MFMGYKYSYTVKLEKKLLIYTAWVTPSVMLLYCNVRHLSVYALQTRLMAALAECEMVWESRWFSSTPIILLIIGLRHMVDDQTILERCYPEYSSYSPPKFGTSQSSSTLQHLIDVSCVVHGCHVY